MSSKFYIFVNGILNNPGSVTAWTDHAEAWIEANEPKSHATRFEYAADILFRRMFQSKRVENLLKVIKPHYGNRLILVGHSNGCDIIQRLVNKAVYHIDELHLIAAASEADFRKNKFNEALKNGMVKKIFVYSSPNDDVLKKAKWSTRLFGWIGLGYGYLGLIGPKHVSKAVSHQVIEIKKGYKHSEWVEENFLETMKTVSGT